MKAPVLKVWIDRTMDEDKAFEELHALGARISERERIEFAWDVVEEDAPDIFTEYEAESQVTVGGITYDTGDFDRADLSANSRISGLGLDERA